MDKTTKWAMIGLTVLLAVDFLFFVGYLLGLKFLLFLLFGYLLGLKFLLFLL